MFQGESAITVDDKGRMGIPAAFRDAVAACDNRLVITYSPFDAGCLFIYPLKIWERVRDQVNALPSSRRDQRLLQRKLVGSAAPVELDGNGRISIPASHRAAVGIEKKAVLLGMGEKFELWSEPAHHAQVQMTLDDVGAGDALPELRL